VTSFSAHLGTLLDVVGQLADVGSAEGTPEAVPGHPETLLFVGARDAAIGRRQL